MSTLGQQLQANFLASQPPVQDYKAREAARIQKAVDAFSQIVEKAKAQICADIAANKDMYCIEYQVAESDAEAHQAYEFLRGIHNKRNMAYSDENRQRLALWAELESWAKSEDLRIELTSRSICNLGELSKMYMAIGVRPLNWI